MYCYNCGNVINDNSTFCSYCGANLRNNETSQNYYPNYDRTTQRQIEISEMENMISYFSQAQPLYNEHDKIVNQIYYSRKNISKKDNYIVLLCILFIIVFYCLNAILVFGVVPAIGISSITSLSQGYFAISAYLAPVIISVLFILFSEKRKKERKNELNNLQTRYEEINKRLYNYYLGYENCPIGPEYTNPANLQAIYDTIVSGRADTTKEAINILIEDAHRNRMENIAATTAAYTQKAAANSGRAATAATVGAVFSVANYFRK